MKHLLTVVATFLAIAFWTFAEGEQPSASTVGTSPEDSLKREIIAIADTAAPDLKFRISSLLETGDGPVARDSVNALKYLRQAADSGYAPALNYLGFKYFKGEGVERDSTKGIALIRRAADLGDPRSYNNLGWLYLQGSGVKKDYPEAAKWFKLASDNGASTAAALLGDMYRDGLGMQPDTLRADSLYTLAISRGLSDAQLRLIDLRHENWKQLSADSALQLGLSFYPAPGPSVGVVLFEHAADLGNNQALALLGDAFSRGVGVKYDNARAIDYYYRAALAGNPSAQFVVAELLDMFPDALADVKGQPYIIDDPQYWYTCAARAGITDAARATEALLKYDSRSSNP